MGTVVPLLPNSVTTKLVFSIYLYRMEIDNLNVDKESDKFCMVRKSHHIFRELYDLHVLLHLKLSMVVLLGDLDDFVCKYLKL